MARIRTIKPEFWTSEQIVECSPTTRLMFIGMWTFADDGGVLPDSWKRIKMQVFPGDELGRKEIESMISDLLKVGLLRRFQHDGHAYLLITGWNHQKIEKPSYKFPRPSKDTKFDDYSTTDRRQIDDDLPAECKGVEGSVEERKVSILSVSEPAAETKPPETPPTKPPPGNGRYEYSQDFEEFWKSYPIRRRTKKGEAYKRWKSACLRVQPSYLIQRAKDYAASEQGQSDFAVMPSVWLNGAMWEDEPEAWTRTKEEPKLSRVFDPKILDTNPYALAEYGYGPPKKELD